MTGGEGYSQGITKVIWTPGMSVLNAMAIIPVIVEIFQSNRGGKFLVGYWTNHHSIMG